MHILSLLDTLNDRRKLNENQVRNADGQ